MDDLIKRKDMLRVLDTTRKAVEIHPSVNTVSIEALNEIRDDIQKEHDEAFTPDEVDIRFGLRKALYIINEKIKEYEE